MKISFNPLETLSNLSDDVLGDKSYQLKSRASSPINKKTLSDIKGVAGSSAGAITAFLVAIGCTPEEIDDMMKGKKTDFTKSLLTKGAPLNMLYLLGGSLRKSNRGWAEQMKAKLEGVTDDWKWDLSLNRNVLGVVLGRIFRINNTVEDTKNALDSRIDIASFLRSILAKKKEGVTKMTFQQLKHFKPLKEDKDQGHTPELAICGTNTTTQKSVLFSQKTTPHMDIVDAVLISMSIPFFFPSFQINEENAKKIIVKSEGGAKGECYKWLDIYGTYVDGGVQDNFPIFKVHEMFGWQKDKMLGLYLGEDENPFTFSTTGPNYPMWTNCDRKNKTVDESDLAILALPHGKLSTASMGAIDKDIAADVTIDVLNTMFSYLGTYLEYTPSKQTATVNP